MNHNWVYCLVDCQGFFTSCDFSGVIWICTPLIHRREKKNQSNMTASGEMWFWVLGKWVYIFSNYINRKRRGGTVLTLMPTTSNSLLHACLCFINNQILYLVSRYGISLRYSEPQAGQGMLGNTEGSSVRHLPKEHALFWVKVGQANWSSYYKIYHQLTIRDKWFWFTQPPRTQGNQLANSIRN